MENEKTYELKKNFEGIIATKNNVELSNVTLIEASVLLCMLVERIAKHADNEGFSYALLDGVKHAIERGEKDARK